MRVGLIGWFHAHNTGDDAALHVVRTGLEARLGCETVPLSTARPMSSPGVVSVRDNGGSDFWRQFDALCWGPGGIFPGAAQLLADDLPPEDVPQVVVSSALPLDDSATAAVARRCRMIWSRVPDAPEGSLIAPDAAYGLQVERTHPGATVVLCPSARCPLDARYHFAALAERRLARGQRVLFFPSAASPGDMDLGYCRDLARETGAECYRDVPTWAEALAVVRNAALVVGLRKHTAVMAQLLGVPSVVCDYWGAFGPLQAVAGGDSMIVGGVENAGTGDEWCLAERGAAAGFDPEPARQHVEAALDRVAEALT